MLKTHPLYIFKDFRSLFLARIISAIGDKFFQIAILWWAMGINKTGKFNVGLVMIASFLPIVLFGPLIGTYVDKTNKKYSMIFADLSRFLILIIIFILYHFNSLNLLNGLLLIFFLSSFTPLFESSVASSLLKLTSKEHLSQATATDSSSIQISNVFGSALGAIFISFIGIKGAFFSNSLTYLLSFIFILSIKTKLKNEKIEPSSYKEDLKEGLSYILKNKPILYLVIFFSFLNFFVSPLYILIPMIVKFILKEDIKWLAIFETFFALGLTLISLLLSFKKDYKKPYLNLFVSIIFAGLFFLFLGFSKNNYLTVFVLISMGAFISLGNIVTLSLFQNNVEEEFKGRFFALITTISYAIMPLSFLINSLLAEKFSVEKIIYYNSIFIILLSFFTLFLPKIEKKRK